MRATIRGSAALAGPLTLVLIVIWGCSGSDGSAPDQPAAALFATGFQVASPNFTEIRPRKRIPVENTCFAEDLSPPLNWSGVPPGAKSLALIAEDRDNGWSHWVLYNIPVELNGLSEGVPRSAPELPDGTKQGTNDDGNIGYNGPCPQPSSIVGSSDTCCSDSGQEGARKAATAKAYHFVLYALDTELGLDTGVTEGKLVSAMKGHILAQAETIGKFMAPPKSDVDIQATSTQTSR